MFYWGIQVSFQQKSTISTLREILRNDGVKGLTKGLTSTLGRHGVWNMVYFGVYHNVKAVLPSPEVCNYQHSDIKTHILLSSEMCLQGWRHFYVSYLLGWLVLILVEVVDRTFQWFARFSNKHSFRCRQKSHSRSATDCRPGEVQQVLLHYSNGLHGGRVSVTSQQIKGLLLRSCDVDVVDSWLSTKASFRSWCVLDQVRTMSKK